MALDLIAELEAIIAAFERAGIEYALCGGLALAVHGHPRFTQDIDLLIEAAQLSDAVRVARDVGFDLPARKMTFGLKTGTPRELQRLSKLDPDTGQLLSLDLLIVAYEYVEVFSRRLRLVWRTSDISVVSRDGLVTMKRLAARATDLRDLDVLEGRDRDSEDDA